MIDALCKIYIYKERENSASPELFIKFLVTSSGDAKRKIYFDQNVS